MPSGCGGQHIGIPAPPTVADAMVLTGMQLAGEAMVDTALDVLESVRADCLPVRDHDGRCSRSITRADLVAVLGSLPSY